MVGTPVQPAAAGTAMTDKLTAALMAYASKKMDGGCALFQTNEEVTACPALTMPPTVAGTGDTAERFVLSDGEADLIQQV